MSRFEDFWEAWPSPTDPRYSGYKRKTDKKKCREIWDKQGLEKKADVILRDVQQRAKYDKGWLQQKGEFLSAPLVYLRNERWDGSEWADVREKRKEEQTGTTKNPDPNKVADWLIKNVPMTEDQRRSSWTWIHDGEWKLTGVEIPGLGRMMFRDLVSERGVSNAA